MKQATTRKTKARSAQSVDEFLAAVPPAARATLQKIRQAIRAAAPEAVEGFSYGVPAFRYKDRPVAAYAAAREHCSYFPMSPAVIKAHAALLKGYDLSKGAALSLSKGTIRFPVGKPLPAALVRKLVRARMAEIDSGSKGYGKR